MFKVDFLLLLCYYVFMREKLRKVDSIEGLHRHLENHGGIVRGRHWEPEVVRGTHGEIVEEGDVPVDGEYNLVRDPDTRESRVNFRLRRGDTPISEKDILEDAVQIVARRRIK
jgi:hypothetical protein